MTNYSAKLEAGREVTPYFMIHSVWKISKSKSMQGVKQMDIMSKAILEWFTLSHHPKVPCFENSDHMGSLHFLFSYSQKIIFQLTLHAGTVKMAHLEIETQLVIRTLVPFPWAKLSMYSGHLEFCTLSSHMHCTDLGGYLCQWPSSAESTASPKISVLSIISIMDELLP